MHVTQFINGGRGSKCHYSARETYQVCHPPLVEVVCRRSLCMSTRRDLHVSLRWLRSWTGMLGVYAVHDRHVTYLWRRSYTGQAMTVTRLGRRWCTEAVTWGKQGPSAAVGRG